MSASPARSPISICSPRKTAPKRQGHDRQQEGDQQQIGRPHPAQQAEIKQIGHRRAEGAQRRQRGEARRCRRDAPGMLEQQRQRQQKQACCRRACRPRRPRWEARAAAGPRCRQRHRRPPPAAPRSPPGWSDRDASGSPARSAPPPPGSQAPTPARRRRVSRSCPAAWAASTVKIGVIAFRIAVSPLSIWVWPQQMRAKGMALLSAPMTRRVSQMRKPRGRPRPRQTATAVRIKQPSTTRMSATVSGP